MMALDTLLRERDAQGRPIRVGLIGAGATGKAVALQLLTPIPGLALAAIANRSAERARAAFQEAGVNRVEPVETPEGLDRMIDQAVPAIVTDPGVLSRARGIDVIVEVTGTVEFAARAVADAISHRKHVVLVNAELDSTLGPLLARRAREAGVVLTNTDGDEPGVAMTLLRYLRSIGLKPVAAGNLKGMVDYYRTPATQEGFARTHGQEVRKVTSFADATKLSMEATILANGSGFRVGRRGMYGPSCDHVSEIAGRLPAEPMLAGGLVDYALGAAPHTGAFVVVHEENPAKQRLLAYYKLGAGPFYVFYTPFHLPHIQVAATIARAALLNDPTVAPLGPPVCETITVAKRDLQPEETLDGVGGFLTYGLVDNAGAAREIGALPMGLSEGCRLVRAVARDMPVRFEDVEIPSGRLIDTLWAEQLDWAAVTASAGPGDSK